MRHRRKINHLSRKTAHRRMMLANMASSLILHKRIHTTLAKAKALRSYIEPLITKSKEDSTHSRRVVFSYLQSKEAVTELFRDVSVKVAERPGGYTRIIKIGARLGDNAEMCMMELVDYNENLLGGETADKGKSRRRRGRGGKKETTKEVEAKKTPAAKEVKPAEVKETEDIKEEVVAEEATAEAVVEAPEEKVEETETIEEKEEAPAAEEKKEEAPTAEEATEAPVAEEKKEAPKAEAAEASEGEEKKEDGESSEEKKEDK